jgi:hypothetical protein
MVHDLVDGPYTDIFQGLVVQPAAVVFANSPLQPQNETFSAEHAQATSFRLGKGTAANPVPRGRPPRPGAARARRWRAPGSRGNDLDEFAGGHPAPTPRVDLTVCRGGRSPNRLAARWRRRRTHMRADLVGRVDRRDRVRLLRRRLGGPVADAWIVAPSAGKQSEDSRSVVRRSGCRSSISRCWTATPAATAASRAGDEVGLTTWSATTIGGACGTAARASAGGDEAAHDGSRLWPGPAQPRR